MKKILYQFLSKFHLNFQHLTPPDIQNLHRTSTSKGQMTREVAEKNIKTWNVHERMVLQK
jgi:hypothetical protein